MLTDEKAKRYDDLIKDNFLRRALFHYSKKLLREVLEQGKGNDQQNIDDLAKCNKILNQLNKKKTA